MFGDAYMFAIVISTVAQKIIGIRSVVPYPSAGMYYLMSYSSI